MSKEIKTEDDLVDVFGDPHMDNDWVISTWENTTDSKDWIMRVQQIPRDCYE